MLLTAVTDDMRDANIKLDMPSQNELNKLERDMDKAQLEVDAAIMECANYTTYIGGIDTLKEKLGDIDESKMEATIESLSMLGVLDKMDISLEELGSVPVDAQKEYLEIGCEGILGAIGDFITKIVEAMLKSIAAVFKFVASVFGFNIGGSGGSGGGTNSKVSKIASKQAKTYNKIYDTLITDSVGNSFKATNAEDVKIDNDISDCLDSANLSDVSEVVATLKKSNLLKKSTKGYASYIVWKIIQYQNAYVDVLCSNNYASGKIPNVSKIEECFSVIKKNNKYLEQLSKLGIVLNETPINFDKFDSVAEATDMTGVSESWKYAKEVITNIKGNGTTGHNIFLGKSGSGTYTDGNKAGVLLDNVAVRLLNDDKILKNLISTITDKKDHIIDRQRLAVITKELLPECNKATQHSKTISVIVTKITHIRKETVVMQKQFEPILISLNNQVK